MAAFQGIAQTAEVALSAATAKTVIQLVAATNHRVKVLRWGVFFDGVSVSAEPVQVRLLRQTTAGTMSSLTPVKLDDSLAETLQTTAQHTATAEPTAGDVVDVVEVHPQSGYEIIYPLGQEVIIGGGDRLGIECTAPAGVNVRAKIVFEE
jgi:hypothetical protein